MLRLNIVIVANAFATLLFETKVLTQYDIEPLLSDEVKSLAVRTTKLALLNERS